MNSSEKKANSAPRLVSGFVYGLCVWLASAVVFLLVASLICYLMPDPDKYMRPASLGALYLSVFLGGFAAAQKCTAAISGLLTGLVALAAVLVAGAFRGDADASYSAATATILYCLIPAVAFAGSFLSQLKGHGKSSKKPSAKRRKAARR